MRDCNLIGSDIMLRHLTGAPLNKPRNLKPDGPRDGLGYIAVFLCLMIFFVVKEGLKTEPINTTPENEKVYTRSL